MLRKLALLGLAAYAGRALFRKTTGSSSSDDVAASDFDAAATRSGARSAGTEASGHAPTDLSGARHPDGSARADDHYRPDIHASVAEEDRESLRPATMPAPHD